jgi:hypothetical protein
MTLRFTYSLKIYFKDLDPLNFMVTIEEAQKLISALEIVDTENLIFQQKSLNPKEIEKIELDYHVSQH